MERDQEDNAVQNLKSVADMVRRLYRSRYKTVYDSDEVRQLLEAAGFQIANPGELKYTSIKPQLTSEMVANQDKIKTFDSLIETKLGEAIAVVKAADVRDVANILATFNQEATSLAATM
jgi:hypothetical protein